MLVPKEVPKNIKFLKILFWTMLGGVFGVSLLEELES